MRPRTLFAAVLATALVACGPSGASSAVTPTVTGAWARPAAAGGMSAAYFRVANSTDASDALLSVTSPTVSAAQVHQTVVDGTGTAAMRPVDRVELPAGATVDFKPGSYHVMLMGLSKDMPAGSTIELDLVFEHAGRVVVSADVRQD
jgi:copper(I)-binding protein